MKLLSIDTETTGLDPNNSMLLEVGIVVYDTEERFVQTSKNSLRIVYCHEYLQGNVFAFDINKNLILNEIFSQVKWFYDNNSPAVRYVVNEEVATLYLNTKEEYTETLELVLENFYEANEIKGRLNIAGKNFASFDKNFLERDWTMKEFIVDRARHRIMDVGSMYARPEDDSVPGLNLCLERAGYPGEVPHTAIEDAILVIKCIEAKFNQEKAAKPADINTAFNDVIPTPDLGIVYDYLAEKFGINGNGNVINPEENPENFLGNKEELALLTEWIGSRKSKKEDVFANRFELPNIDSTSLDDYTEEGEDDIFNQGLGI